MSTSSRIARLRPKPQQQNSPVEAEALARGDGGEGHGNHFIHGHGGLQDLADLVQKFDFATAGIALRDQGMGFGPQAQYFFDGVGEEASEAVLFAVELAQGIEEMGTFQAAGQKPLFVLVITPKL
ncbi:MAG: hypothetical protein P8X63_08875 [Desulfuromonadaceae bacterium]